MDRTLHPRIAIRRTRLWLLLPLLLVLSQQSAWLHALSHVTYAANAHQVSVDQAQSSFENGLCPSCQSFGQLGAALSSSLAAVPAPAPPLCPQAAPCYSPPAAPLPAPRNRGPPLLA
ncbi:MAG TPA: hypothetical protein VHW25_18005 [Steroidobacteraceae bacterium]|jgi:hypothetical protein|nr:hypothetical protein [Steroidobacteraceae bacterium]